MKKLVLTCAFLFGCYSSAFAQENQENINWLQLNKVSIDFVGCPTTELYGDHLEITEESIKLYDEVSSCKINWFNVLKVGEEGEYLYILSKENVNNKPLELKFYIKERDTHIKFLKAFTNLANANSKYLVTN